MTKRVSIPFLIVVALVSTFSSCEKMDLDAPACVIDEVKAILKEDVRNPPARVWRWVVDVEV